MNRNDSIQPAVQMAGYDPDQHSVASYDFIPSPHNQIASLAGPPTWHEAYQAPEPAQTSNQPATPLKPPTWREAYNGAVLGYNTNLIYYCRQLAEDCKGYSLYKTYGTHEDQSPYNMILESYPEEYRFGNLLVSPDRNISASYRHNSPATQATDANGTPMACSILNAMASEFVPLNQPAAAYMSQPTPNEAQLAAAARAQETRARNVAVQLCNPPPGWNDHPDWVVVGLPFIIQTMPKGHMEFSKQLNRMVLSKDSEFYKYGQKLGLSAEYVAWLRGENTANVFISKRSALRRNQSC